MRKDFFKMADNFKDNAELQSINLFAVQEAYKTIRTNVTLSIIKEGCKTIVVTSSLPSEGKTTTSLNLSISLAQAYKKVLLIDCDLRKSKMHKVLGIPNVPGLTNVISGLETLENSARETKYAGLHVLTAGIQVPNPSEVLSSEAMFALLEDMKASYDYIILDTPPLNIVADALPLSRVADGTLIVVKQNQTTHIDLSKAIESLEFIGGKIAGIILNGVETSDNRYYKYKYKLKAYQ